MEQLVSEKELTNILRRFNVITNLSISIVNHCNIDCIFCFLKDRKNRKFFMDLDLFKEILPQAREIGVIEIELTGGEPFLHPEIEFFFESAYSYNMSVSVTSNGTFIPVKRVLKYMLDCKFDMLRISIHGANPHTHDKLVRRQGAFESSVNNVLKLKKYGVNVFVIFLVNKYNFQEIEEAYKFWKEFDIEVGFSLDIIGSEMKDLYLTEDNLKEVIKTINCLPKSYKYANNRSCSAMEFSLHVTTNGFLTPCITIPVSLGSLRDNSLKEILSSQSFIKLREDFRRYIEDTIERGEFYCPGSNYLTTGNMFQHHFYNGLLNKVYKEQFGGRK